MMAGDNGQWRTEFDRMQGVTVTADARPRSADRSWRPVRRRRPAPRTPATTPPARRRSFFPASPLPLALSRRLSAANSAMLMNSAVEANYPVGLVWWIRSSHHLGGGRDWELQIQTTQ